jgi:hypothetical protein
MTDGTGKRRRAPSNFRQQDVARAIKAAKSGGLDIPRVDVDPKTARIVLITRGAEGEEEKTELNPFDTAPLPSPMRKRK